MQSKRLVRKINRKLDKGKVINTSAASTFRGAMNKAHKHPCFASHVPNVCGVARNSRRKRFDCSARFRIWHHFPLFLARRIFIPYINGPIASLHVAQPSSAKAKYCASEFRKGGHKCSTSSIRQDKRGRWIATTFLTAQNFPQQRPEDLWGLSQIVSPPSHLHGNLPLEQGLLKNSSRKRQLLFPINGLCVRKSMERSLRFHSPCKR